MDNDIRLPSFGIFMANIQLQKQGQIVHGDDRDNEYL